MLLERPVFHPVPELAVVSARNTVLLCYAGKEYKLHPYLRGGMTLLQTETWVSCPVCGEDHNPDCPVCDGFGQVLA